MAYGLVGAIVAAWPAPALVISYELLMIVIRSNVVSGVPGVSEPSGTERLGVPAGGKEAAERFADDLARGEVPGVRRIRRELRVGQPKAQRVREYLADIVSSNAATPTRYSPSGADTTHITL